MWPKKGKNQVRGWIGDHSIHFLLIVLAIKTYLNLLLSRLEYSSLMRTLENKVIIEDGDYQQNRITSHSIFKQTQITTISILISQYTHPFLTFFCCFGLELNLTDMTRKFKACLFFHSIIDRIHLELVGIQSFITTHILHFIGAKTTTGVSDSRRIPAANSHHGLCDFPSLSTWYATPRVTCGC